MRNAFFHFRQVWSPRAAYHLARLQFGEDWRERLISAIWLISEKIPLNGAAPSCNFKGLGVRNV